MNESVEDQGNSLQDFESFLAAFRAELKDIFQERQLDPSTYTERGFRKEVLERIMNHKPLQVAIPTEYGGHGALPQECMSLLETASYESIPLTLIFGINIALFLEPFAKYGEEEIKQRIFSTFLQEQAMGGLMITEPDHGSDALNMKTSYTSDTEGRYNIKGTKHWQGLTGMADYWLVAARQKRENSDNLSRDVDLFVTEDNISAQHINVTELYDNYGLYPIPYGKNEIDIQLPKTHRLIPESTGIKMLMDTLHRSRMQFPGMAIGFIKRALETAKEHCRTRMVRGQGLTQYDEVQRKISRIESAFTICSAMCFRSAQCTSIKSDLSLFGIEANAFKAVVSDLMQETAQILTQLLGGKGYMIGSLGARSIMDSRPFQIFEGPNAMLFTQLAEMVFKQMTKAKELNLAKFLGEFDMTRRAIQFFKEMMNFSIDKNMIQRKRVLLGEALAKVILADHVISLSDAGFNENLTDNCISRLINDVSNLINQYTAGINVTPLEDSSENSSWLSLC